jgi:cytochrome c553
MKTLTLLATITMMAFAGATLAAADVAAGKAKAAQCAQCHGARGEGQSPTPPLAGKNEAELVQALKDFKSGKRTNSAMKMFASKLSDDDMSNLAAYYSSLKSK